MPTILGIDIGTSSSAVAYTTGEFPVILPPREESGYDLKGFLSCLMFEANGRFLKAAGKVRKGQDDKDSGFLLRYFKRIMGYSFEEMRSGIKREGRFLNEYKDVIERKGGGGLLIHLGKEKYTPESIMAIFLKEIETYAEEMIGETIDEAILTVPSHFGPAQRESMRKAGETVFKSVELIEEPLAAILGGKLHAEAGEKPVVIFDLGIGNLEIKVTEIGLGKGRKPNLITLNKTESRKIGGIDMDYAILEYLMERNRNLRDAFPAASPKERRSFLWMIEDARIALSSRLEARVTATIGDQPIEERLTRRELEEIIKPIINDCEDTLRQALNEGELHPEKVSHLILVGGPIRMPAVRKMLKEVFRDNARIVGMLNKSERDHEMDLWPMEIVARGAAAYPAVYPSGAHRVLSGEAEEAISGAPFTYGFFYDDIGIVPLIYKGTGFEEDGMIRRESTAVFSRPHGQIPVIQRDERKGRPHSYLCFGIFNFFLPLRESYEMKLMLELSNEGLTLIGSHYAIGEVVYPHISLELNSPEKKAVDKTTLKEHIHNLMIEDVGNQKGSYKMMDSDIARRYAEVVHEKIAKYYRIPEIKDMTDRLADALYWFKKDYSAGQVARQIEKRTAVLLNRIAEACFTLLRYELLPFNNYRDMIRALHGVYRFGVRGANGA